MKKLRAVIFDMDGLMLDSERLAIQSLKRAGVSIGLDLSESILVDCIGLNEESANEFLAQALGRPIPKEALSAAFYADYEATLERDGIPLKPGLIELLEFLENGKIRRAVATSTATALAARKLSKAGILQYFEFIVGGDVVKHGKPAPDPYIQAAERLDTSIEYCLALEDSENGARSALAAGMRVIIVPDIKPLPEPILLKAQVCLQSLHDVKKYLIHSKMLE